MNKINKLLISLLFPLLLTSCQNNKTPIDDGGQDQEEDRRPLGHRSRAELHLHASEPGHQRIRSQHDLPVRPRPRRQRHGRAELAGRFVHGDLSQHHPGCGRHEETGQAVFVPRRHREPRGA